MSICGFSPFDWIARTYRYRGMHSDPKERANGSQTNERRKSTSRLDGIGTGELTNSAHAKFAIHAPVVTDGDDGLLYFVQRSVRPMEL